MRVLLLDGQVNPAVAAVRSLGRAGQRVLVGSSGTWSKAGWSRYASGSFTYPSAQNDVEGFVSRIAALAGEEAGTLVFPITEKTVMTLSEHRSLIEATGACMVMPPHSVMLRAYDKAYTTRTAAEVGVETPRTCLISGERSAQRMAADFPYPAVLKARTSVEVGRRHVTATARPLYARNPQEFLDAYRELHRSATHVIVQEFIDGEGVVYCLLMCRGELRAEFAYRRIRSVHPTGWGACVRVSIPPDLLRSRSLKVIRALDPQWTGLASVEYRLRSDGTPFFLEVNPRAWNSLALAVYAGVDFPQMLAEIAEHGDTPSRDGYFTGVVCRWWLGDLRRLLYVWKGTSASYPGRIQGRFSALVDFLKPSPHAFHDNFTPTDPLPELGDWLGTASRALHRVAGTRVAT